MDEETLDLKGLKCPLPALLARRALDRLPAGTLLVVQTTDPLAVVDIPHMCGEEGHDVISTHAEKDGAVFRIRRKA